MFTVCCAAALVLAGCGGSSHSSSPTTAGSTGSAGSTSVSATGSPYRIGVMTDLTGSGGATLGVPELQGVQFWADQLNAAGGIDNHPVRLDTCDSQSTAQGGVTCGSKLASDPVVLALSLIGDDEAALPSLTHSLVFATTPLLLPTKAKTPNVYQGQVTIAEADSAALAAAQKTGIHSVGVIATDDATGSGAVKAMQSVAGKYGVTLDVQYVTEAVTSATVQVAKLQSDHVGMVFVATPGQPAAVSAEAYKTLDLSAPLVMTDANATNSFLKSIASTNLQSLYAASALPIAPGSVPASYPGAQKLESVFAAYKAKTGQVMDAGPFQAYVVAQLVGGVLQGAGYGASLSALESYANTHDLTTDLGVVNFRDPVSNVEQGISPTLVQMAPDRASWTVCQASAALKC